MDSNQQEFTSEELSRYNGRDGAPAYIAYEGKVYDVSGSFLWKGGKHMVVHYAGTDLTSQISSAPHDADELDNFPVVGILVD
jgi:predicted heme/steroid binding protein